ncbi:MAG TPA: substrate-binding domain-containing protein, partial [Polyangiaceae bacterium]|nr:substrate-binding domain-containing protein [Polyangiaceae bacterium]
MKRRRTTVALLVDRLMSEYAVMLRRSIERAATRNDVSIVVAVGQSVRDKEPAAATQNQIYSLINQDSVDGVIIVSAILGHYCGIEGLVQMCRGYAPLPVCSLGVELPGVPSIIIENQGGTRLGVEHLIDVHGSRRIALIAGPETSVESDLRIEGYRAALERRGLTVDESLIAHGTFTLPSGRDCMIELMQRGVSFDAVVSANDDMALGAMDVLRESNLRVPRDLLVLGFDDINSAHFARPPLSTLRQPIWWMGESAVDSILRQLRGEAVPLVQAGAVELVRRESCGCGYRATTIHQSKGSLRPSVHGIIQERRAEIAQ